MADHHVTPEVAKTEPDGLLVRYLGLALLILLPILCFFIGTVVSKDWFVDYNFAEIKAGLRFAFFGLVIALFINLVMNTWYQRVLKDDAVDEWYGPQSGHH
jgi:hypothetical protein